MLAGSLDTGGIAWEPHDPPMKLLLAVVLISIYLGYLFGGRLKRLEALRPRWWGLVIVGLGIQFIHLPEGTAGTDLVVRTAVLALSYTLLVTFAAANIRMPGMALVLIGLACNCTVIVANGGMPASAQALIDSGQQDVLVSLRSQPYQKHHLLTDEDQLTFLADVIAVPQPIGQAVSLGDLFVYAGLVWLVIATMRGWTPSETPEGSRRRRGRHRPGAAREEPEVRTDLGFLPPGATRSGTGP
jgi:Family of unknown function (DUF5317)